MGDVSEERAIDVHRRAVIVNMLAGAAQFPTVASPAFALPAVMRRGGTTAASWSIAGTSEDFRATCTKLAGALAAIDASTDPPARLVRTVADIVAAKERGEAAFILNVQNADPLDGSLEYLHLLHRLGLRVLQLTYQRRNLAGDGCGEPGPGAGLSLFGRSLVKEMNALGMLIDLSHCSDGTTLDAIECSQQPVAFTHVNMRALNPHPRNKPDDQIRLVAERGGVIGINSVSRMISPRGREEGASLEQFVEQIEHVVDLVGIDHVGIGLDRSEDLTEELMEVRRRTFLARYPELQAGGDFAFETYYARDTSMGEMLPLVRCLLGRGYTDADVEKVLGGNWLRLLDEVWRPA